MNINRALAISLEHGINAWAIPGGVAVEIELVTAKGNWLTEVVPCYSMEQLACALGY